MSKATDNLEIIRTLKLIEAEQREVTEAERAQMAGYTGWGALAAVLDESKAEHENERGELAQLVGADGVAELRSSILDAYFTPDAVVDAMWKGMVRLGAGSGLVLEPSAGTGAFIRRAPDTIRLMTAVEKEPVTAALCREINRGRAKVVNRPFESLSLRDEAYHAAIGNPPYIDVTVTDRQNAKISGPVHTAIIAKAMQKVAKGGVGAFIVTRYLMDSLRSCGALEWLEENTRLVDGYRLPKSVFKPEAEVVTDVLFFQRCAKGQGNPDAWSDNKPLVIGSESVSINQWFVENPEKVLGQAAIETDRFGKLACTVNEDGDWLAALDAAMDSLPENITGEVIAADDADPAITVNDRGRTKVFGYAFDAKTGKPVSRLPDHEGERRWRWADFGKTQEARLSGMIHLRDTLADLIALEKAEQNAGETPAMQAARANLNAQYDAFVKKYGPIHGVGNRNVFRADPDYSMICALELDFEPGISKAVAKKEGVEPIPPSWEKADIFKRRSITPLDEQQSVTSAADALIASLRQHGRVNLRYMEKVSGLKADQLVSDLGDALFCENPIAGKWVTRDEYLSGNVVEKLAKARELVDSFPQMQRNVEALEAVQPEPIEPLDIYVPVNAGWLPGEVVDDFIEHLIDKRPDTPSRNVAGTWITSLNPWDGNHVKQSQTWGTDDMRFGDLFPKMLNNKPLKVFWYDEERRAHVDKEATLAVNEKADEIRLEFEDWLWMDAERRDRLAKLYNERFNTDRERSYDGSFLFNPDGSLPGANPEIRFDQHQQNAVWRGVASKSVLLDHCVGAGKTFVAVATAEVQRRMGLVRKPMFVVPNHLVAQWGSEYARLFPSARIFRATQDDMQKANRPKTLAAMAMNDWDAIILAHDSFTHIDAAPEYESQFLDQMLDAVMASLKEEEQASGKGSKSFRQLEKQRKRIASRLETMLTKSKRQVGGMTMEEIGSTMLIDDEWHSAHKNLLFFTGHHNVGGLGQPEGSIRAFDAFIKAQAIQDQPMGKLALLTATPLSNSIAEFFHVMRFLCYRDMEARGIEQFDAWAAVFSEPTSSYELTVTGKYALKTRFKTFRNLPELLTMYRGVADVVTQEDLDAARAQKGQRSNVPPITGGKPTKVICKRSPAQVKIMEEILERGESLSGVDPRKDNMLKLYSDANKAALHPKLYDPALDHDDRDSKVGFLVENAVHEYRKWDADRGTQIIFCDLGTPKPKGQAGATVSVSSDEDGDQVEGIAVSKAGFVLYNHLKDELSKHIPADQIAFIHDAKTDAQKAKLFRDMNRGKLRILIASTQKGGAGMNVQERITALHDLDAPLRPSDLEQRMGRAIRRGNILYRRDPDNFTVSLYRYGTELTLDALRWQTLETKQVFITQLRRGDVTSRSAEDIDGESVEFASMKAELSGNPLILRKFQIEQRISQLESLERSHKRKTWGLQSFIRANADYAEHYDQRMTNLEADAALIESHDELTFERHNRTYRGDDLKDALAQAINTELQNHGASALYDGVPLGRVNGLKLELRWNRNRTTDFILRGQEFLQVTKYAEGKTINTPGLITRLGNMLDRVDAERDRLVRLKGERGQELAEAQAQVNRPFAAKKELDESRAMNKRITLALEKGETEIEGEDMGQVVGMDDAGSQAPESAPVVTASAEPVEATGTDGQPAAPAPARRSPAGVARRGGGVARRSGGVARPSRHLSVA